MVVIFGCGGVGSHLAYLIAKSNIEDPDRITLVDYDTVEEKNLNRQMFTRDDIGKPKVLALKRYLQESCPGADISAINEKIDDPIKLGIFPGDEMAFICTDSKQSKELISSYFRYCFIINCEQDYMEIKTVFDQKEQNAWVFNDGYNSTQTFRSNIAAAVLAWLFWISPTRTLGVCFKGSSLSIELAEITGLLSKAGRRR